MATQPKPQPKPEPDPPEPDEDQAAKQQPSPAFVEGRRATTFGERAVGLNFNPSGDHDVTVLKQAYAQIIDLCHQRRQSLMAGSETHRLWSVAITEAQGAQMWSVKAATFKE